MTEALADPTSRQNHPAFDTICPEELGETRVAR